MKLLSVDIYIDRYYIIYDDYFAKEFEEFVIEYIFVG